MRKMILFLAIAITCFTEISLAQPGSGCAQDAVERKMDSTYRKKGRKALHDVSYKNDKRYKDANNHVLATLVFVDTIFKRHRAKTIMTDKMVFGKHGEAYSIHDELKDKAVMTLMYDYAEKAMYMVKPDDRTAIKMPLINMQRMITAHGGGVDYSDNTNIKATDEYATIAGFKARKYIITTRDDDKVDMWVTKGLTLGDNYVMGARLNAYKFPKSDQFKDMGNGFAVRMVLYNDKGDVKSTMTMTDYSKTVDEKIFDLSDYKVTDILDHM